MQKSKEILEQKATSSQPLKSAIDIETVESINSPQELKPTEMVTEDGKKVLVFSDPLFSREKRSVVNYSIFNGKWEFENMDDLDENDPEKCAIKFTPQADACNITIAFKSLKDRVEFMDSIYSDNEMKQIGTGMSFENLANSKVLKTTGGVIGLSLVGLGLYKWLGKKES